MTAWTCSVTAIVYFLGFMPPKGTEIIVPQSALDRYSVAQRIKARVCAERHGIKWRVAP